MTDINWASLHRLPGRHPETAHVAVCERPWSDCAVCYSWLKELAEAYRAGRLAVDVPDAQTGLDDFAE